MSKHTPGPWFAVGGWVEVERDDIADICSCCPEDFGQEHIGRNYKEVMANARLIAAAPELLSALKEIVQSLADQDDEGMIEHTLQMSNARAAIAKAEGK